MFNARILGTSKVSILLFTLLVTFSQAQDDTPPRPRPELQETIDQNAPAVWNFKEYDEISKSTVRIVVSLNRGGKVTQAHGSGVIISRLEEKHPTIEGMTRGYIVTCAHVTPKNDTLAIVIEYQNGMTSEAQILETNSVTDVALLRAWIPVEYTVIAPATIRPVYSDIVFCCGYGQLYNCKKPRYFECKVFRSSPLIISLLEDAVPGDSGGPIFNEEGKLVGLISQGRTAFQTKGSTIYTGPASGPSVLAIKQLISVYLTRSLSGIND